MTMPRTPSQGDENKLLRSTEVAHLLDISPDEVLDLAKQGRIKAVKEGRFWKFRYADVIVYRDREGKGE
jgi:excisionase family DNA binding protein